MKEQQCDIIITVDDTVKKLEKAIEETGRIYDMGMIHEAIKIAKEAHLGQYRSSGEEFVCHPIEVAIILVELGMDSETIVVAILHDVVEDTEITLEELSKKFGENVAELVDGVTKLGNIPFSSKEEEQAENVRKMLLAMAKDIRVIIIKLADRLHNMRTIGCRPEQNRRDNAKETMDIYAPLAHRLGIRGMKEELEDLSLRILDPVAYGEIEEELALHSDEQGKFLSEIKEVIEKTLDKELIKGQVSGRIKSNTGIYKKMFVEGRDFEAIYDIYAVRIIVDNINDCYNVLGIIHDMFRPIPNRFKDYISTPKPNMYQSLHTTVISTQKIPFEVQIRTWDMHYTAEYGIAAHWKYKLGINKRDRLEERLVWVRQFIESQKDVDDAADIVQSIKTDLSSDEVFVFTPRGDVINLPVGATAIDFAYSIHSDVGNRMGGAKVDGRMVPIDYEVQNGEIVEVLKAPSRDQGPSRDWLNIVKTGEARNKIRAWFKKERREENIEQGKDALLRELSRNGIRLRGKELEEFILKQAKKQHVQTVDDFYAAVGYGGITLARVMPQIKNDYNKEYRKIKKEPEDQILAVKTQTRRKNNTGGVIIEGMDDFLVKFSKCCNPVPGDDIVGFITRGHGVSIHKRDCVNVPKGIESVSEADRWIDVEWEDKVHEDFKATLSIVAKNRNALIADVTTALASMHVMLNAISAREPKDSSSVIMQVTIGVRSLDHLETVVKRLERVPDVYKVERSGF